MSKQINKVSVRQLHGEPQSIGWCYDYEVVSILRLNQQYKIKGLPMFMVEAIGHVGIDYAIKQAKVGEEYDK